MQEQYQTISRREPPLKSMRYDFLRLAGIEFIQKVAGKIWTDHNSHDPGISILEVLAFAITDLGYRVNYPMEDILAHNPDGSDKEIKNFFTAREILHNCPVTFNDYRKLLIDVDVHDPSTPGCEFAGIKNGWIEIAAEAEQKIYVRQKGNKLDYFPDPDFPGQKPLFQECLYNILLEFSSCEAFGDFNDNRLQGDFMVENHVADPPLNGMTIRAEVSFPRWDEDVDWQNLDSIKKNIKEIKLFYFQVPAGYQLDFSITPENGVYLKGTKPSPSGPVDIDGLDALSVQMNDFLYNTANGLIVKYSEKINKVAEILDAVKERLHANRNLCEDYYRFKALRIEDIIICADIELEISALAEDVLARIYFEVGRFLAPDVKFYSLEEMVDKGKSTEEIFNGPKLKHGFILDEELEASERRKVIHVSDLINIIMDIPGVIAVKNLQIATLGHDGAPPVEPKAVKWCLDLAFEENFTPRLNINGSKVLFFKDELPLKAGQLKVEELIKELESLERPQKLHNPALDYRIPPGEFKEIEDYTSIQNDFPMVYGIGEEGLPRTASQERKARALQLKGFLMHFDQLLGNFLSQLHHSKYLFAMNSEKDVSGNFKIGRTYFTKSLFGQVPVGAPQFVNDQNTYESNLDDFAESTEVFEERRNRFLDHLMARFAEQFTDYALLTFKLSGPKAPAELIEDKLSFLNSYPKISSGRGKALNYKHPCDLWHYENVSGLEKRAALLAGINEWPLSNLNFSPNFDITESAGKFSFTVSSDVPDVLLKSLVELDSEDLAKEMLERVVINGVCIENFRISDNGDGTSHFDLFCGEELLATSYELSFADEILAASVVDDLQGIFEREFYHNPESNRKNLTCPLKNYFKTEVVVDLVSDPPEFTLNFILYSRPFLFKAENALLEGTFTGKGEPKKQASILSAVTATNKIIAEGDITQFLPSGATALIFDSNENDGVYTVLSASEVGGNTEIILNETLMGNTVPLGTLHYNTDSEEELLALAEMAAHEILFRLVVAAQEEKNYSYLEIDGSYVFNIVECGEVIAASIEEYASESDAREAVLVLYDFIRERFFRHEGLHLIEHILLRPKYHLPFVVADSNTLDDTLVVKGSLKFEKEVPVKVTIAGLKVFVLEGDFTPAFAGMTKVTAVKSSGQKQEFTIDSVFVFKTYTIIQVLETIPTGEVFPKISIEIITPVKAYNSNDKKIIVPASETGGLTAKNTIEIEGSEDEINDGRYLIDQIIVEGANLEIIIEKKQLPIRDRLLSINLEEDCGSCALENPYNYIASVVLPYWPGRFTNRDFRRFFEKTLRREAPAHVFLTICWINCAQMDEFERKYKAWLVENSRKIKSPEKLSRTLDEFIDILERLRTVYPTGTLHDCEADENLESAIILDTTQLGTF